MAIITLKMLDQLLLRINETAGTPTSYCTKLKNGTMKMHPGHYHLDFAYGGCKFVQLDNEQGGIHSISDGYVPKREVYQYMQAFLRGLQTMKESTNE